MAARKTGTAKPESKPTAVPTFTVEESDLDLKVNRIEKPNPLEGALSQSLSTGKALQVPHAGNEDAAKDIENYLRRAAKKLGCGLSLRRTDTHVVFQGKAERVARKYTSDRVREWAADNGIDNEYLFPRIHADVRKAFRVAHGLQKADEAKTA